MEHSHTHTASLSVTITSFNLPHATLHHLWPYDGRGHCNIDDLVESDARRCDDRVLLIDMCLNSIDLYAYGWGFLPSRSHSHTRLIVPQASHFTISTLRCGLVSPFSLFGSHPFHALLRLIRKRSL